MRRLLVALALCAGLVAVPGEAAPAPATPPAAPEVAPPGAVAVAPVESSDEWLRATRAAFAGPAERAGQVLHPPGPRAAAEVGDERDRHSVYRLGDLDGDRVEDVVHYRSVYVEQQFTPSGWTQVTVHSGRTGEVRWRRRFENLAAAGVIQARVGRDGKPGLVLAHLTVIRHPLDLEKVVKDPLSLLRPRDERRLRLIGLTGDAGRMAYDRTITTEDGRGDIQYGGTFDAVQRGGTELLFGRIQRLAPLLLNVQPFILDGSDGTLRAARRPELAVANGAAYLAAGDIDLDSRDDFVEARELPQGLGSVAAHSPLEERTLWTASPVPVGPYLWLGGTGNVTGGLARDVVLNSQTYQGSFKIAGLPPDELPLLPRYGTHGLLFDGGDGTVRWDRVDGAHAEYTLWGDVNGDGKRDVLAQAEFTNGARDGIRIMAVSGANKEIYRREITLAPPVGAVERSVYTYAVAAGKLDGDRLADVAFHIISAEIAIATYKSGLFLVGQNHPVVTEAFPLLGSVDGGTDERVRMSWTRTGATYTVYDGWRGGAYWTIKANAAVPTPLDAAYWGLAAIQGARCDSVLLLGSASGAFWLDYRDGRTGRTRWSKTFRGVRPATTVAVSGRAARCR